jgi:hypothetical protein
MSGETEPLFVEKKVRTPCMLIAAPFWSTICAVIVTNAPAVAVSGTLGETLT